HSAPSFFFCLIGDGAPRDLHSFPTRRSSDLCPRVTTSTCRTSGRAGWPEPCPREDQPASRPAASTSCRPQRAASCGSCVTSTRRSEEHTSELQSRENLVCRLLLEKKKKRARI